MTLKSSCKVSKIAKNTYMKNLMVCKLKNKIREASSVVCFYYYFNQENSM